jgi:hypothetical protein
MHRSDNTLYTSSYPVLGFLDVIPNGIFEEMFDFITNSPVLVGISHLLWIVYNNILGKISHAKYIILQIANVKQNNHKYH